jgi:hypothetical protein
VALALVERGARVTLIEGRGSLMSGAASANEGKIHLGYMYANDPTLATARTMMRGALSFEPFLRRHLSCSPEAFRVSRPAIYSVHRDSQVPPDGIGAYLRKVHALVGEMVGADRGLSYFGQDVTAPLRERTRAERDLAFDPVDVVGAFETPEVAINPAVLADLMRERVIGEPRIELRLGRPSSPCAPRTGASGSRAWRAERGRRRPSTRW